MSSYFSSSNRRGEIQELSTELNHVEIPRKLEALKKIIAQMTIGKDVSPLFQQVIKCLEHPEIELKKLVYLYIINYSRNKPDDAIMVINLFRKDVMQGTPLIKGLALRTMGCIRVKKLNEYLIDPLKQGLNDEDAYVRKTACLCVPKVYEINQSLVENNGFITKLQQILKQDTNPLVIANTCLSLYEISQIKGKSVLTITSSTLQKLLISVNECMEWGEVFILDCLSVYTPADSAEAESIIERILPRLSHINPSVVFAAIKIIVKYLDFIDNLDSIKSFTKKISQPLVTLVNWEQHEIQYVILRNVGFLLQKRPTIFEKEIKVFYCKFNDPYYIKLEKIDIIVKLADQKNYEQILNELREYASEVNQEFVRKVIKGICNVCLSLEQALDKSLDMLGQILKESEQQHHLINEIMISFQLIYRRYPLRFVNYNSSLKSITQYFSMTTEPEAKAAAIWILGEFADQIEDCIQQLGQLIEQVKDEDRLVQLSTITAAVKIFLKFPTETQQYISQILQEVTNNSDNPDVRDRAYIYWRMLSSDPKKTKSIVLGQKPGIRSDISQYDIQFTNQMIDNLASISSVHHKLPQQIFKKQFKFPATENIQSESKKQENDKESKNKESVQDIKSEPQNIQQKQQINPENKQANKQVQQQQQAMIQQSNTADLLDLLDNTPVVQTTQSTIQQDNNSNNQQNLGFDFDLLDISGQKNNYQEKVGIKQQPILQQNATQQKNKIDDLDFLDEVDTQQCTSVELENVLNEGTMGINGQKGLKIKACFERKNNQIYLRLNIQNFNNLQVDDIQVQIRPNFFSLGVEMDKKYSVPAKSTQELSFAVNNKGQEDIAPPSMPLVFNIGIKSSLDMFLCAVPCMFHILLLENGKMSKDMFKQQWKAIPESNEISYEVQNLNTNYFNLDNLKQILQKNNIFFMAQRKNDQNQNVQYNTAKSINNSDFLIEIVLPSLQNSKGCTICVKSQQHFLIPLFLQCINYILTK